MWDAAVTGARWAPKSNSAPRSCRVADVANCQSSSFVRRSRFLSGGGTGDGRRCGNRSNVRHLEYDGPDLGGMAERGGNTLPIASRIECFRTDPFNFAARRRVQGRPILKAHLNPYQG